MVLDHDFECKEKLCRLCQKSIKKLVPKVSFYKIKYHLQELKQKWVSSKNLSNKNWNACFTDSVSIR